MSGSLASRAPLCAGPALGSDAFAQIRQTMELDHEKWDAQVGDETTLASFPLLMDRSTWRTLAEEAEALSRETLAVERELLARPDLHARLALPGPIRALLGPGAAKETPAAARVMRFDFHWTTRGWLVSEVNSDVPGGYTEAEAFTGLVAAHVPGARPAGEPASALTQALSRAVGGQGTIALLSAPGHMEDHQVVAHLARRLREAGMAAHPCSSRNLRFEGGRAHLEMAQLSGEVQAVVRFYQVEWLAELPRDAGWGALFAGGKTPVVNPGVAALSESKRLPLSWDALKTPVPAWRRLSPEVREPSEVKWRDGDDWVLKLAYGNTGDHVHYRSATPSKVWSRLGWRVRLQPGRWVAQRRFEIVPIESPLGEVFPCVGVYTVDGRACGVYGRVSRGPVVKGTAIDVAVLVREEESP